MRIVRTAPFKFFLSLLTALCLAVTVLSGIALVSLEILGVFTGSELTNNLMDRRISTYTNNTFDNFLYGWDINNDDPNFVYSIENLLSGETEADTGIGESERQKSIYYVLNEDGSPRFYHHTEPVIDADSTKEAYRITGGYRKDPVERGTLYETVQFLQFAKKTEDALPAVTVVSLILTVAGLVFLCTLAGHRPDTDEIILNRADRIPSDLFLACVGVSGVGIFVAAAFLFQTESVRLCLTGMGVLGITASLIAVESVYTTAARIKGGTLIKSSLTYRFLRWFFALLGKCASRLKRILAAIPTVPATAAVMGLLAVGNVILGLRSYNFSVFLLLFAEWCVLFLLAILFAWGFSNLRKKTKDLAQGNLDTKIDVEYLYGPLKTQAEDLNRIGDGMNAAVTERLKSERMKTELISNVSHDIKTPLTSIVNYTDLLGKEEGLSEQASEYLHILQRQSARLKKLTEDVIEASKASSGAVTLDLAPCDLGVLLEQGVAEYEAKTKEKGLTVLLSKPKEPVTVIADGRRLWRVFDNLINNICKYALEGTRVYLDLTEENGAANITFRNISKEPLNMNPEELTERFVRGDRSRNTEGSGLGLSIARSLTELQNGTFSVLSDGDLFKVTVVFPLAK